MRHLQLYMLAKSRRGRPQHRSFDNAARRSGLGCGLFLLVLLAVSILGGTLLYAAFIANLPSLDRLPVLLNKDGGLLRQPTQLYDRSGQHLIYSLENPGIERRYLSVDPALPDHFSPLLAQMLVFSDDPHFWQHSGVTWDSLSSSTPVTLAERLVDRFLLDQEPASLRRTFRMHFLAGQITSHFGRAQILEWYLNSAYFGHLTFGADSAAEYYFGKTASDLDLAEVAMLIGMEESPALNLADAPEAAVENQKVVLDRLLSRGYINSEDYLKSRAERLEMHPSNSGVQEIAYSFSKLVMDELSWQISRDRLERGGLRILTTLDYALQMELDCAARTQLNRIRNETRNVDRMDGEPCSTAQKLPAILSLEPGLSEPAQAAVMVLDTEKGEVLAYTGALTPKGPTEKPLAYHPGSLLTPFIALEGFARGMGPASLMWDLPASRPDFLSQDANPDSTYYGPVRLRSALANDYLAPFAQLLDQIGPSNAWRLAEPFGLHGLEKSQNPEALLYEGGSTSMIELAQAYATIAGMGTQHGSKAGQSNGIKPATVQTVQSAEGEMLIPERRDESITVLNPALAYLAHDILADDVARQPSLGNPSPIDLDRPYAVKIGTADEGRQVWTAGYSRQRLAITWIGLPAGSSSRLKFTWAAGLWSASMTAASQNLPAEGWNEPAGISHVKVCSPSGLLPTSACPNVVDEVFLNGSEPVEIDSLYKTIQINRQTGKLATVFTPFELLEEKTFMVLPTEARDWAAAAGLVDPPSTFDTIRLPQPLTDVQVSNPKLFAYVHGQVEVQGTAAGENFEAYYVQVGQGLNPKSWLKVGETGNSPLVNGKLAMWNTTGLDGLYSLRLQVVRKDQTVQTMLLQVTVDNTPPEARATYPDAGQQLEGRRTITLQAAASDNIDVVRVEWWLDGKLVGSRVQAPYSLPWTAAPGKHSLVVKALDGAGNETQSSAVEFQVK